VLALRSASNLIFHEMREDASILRSFMEPAFASILAKSCARARALSSGVLGTDEVAGGLHDVILVTR
jgi:hypothetical protein